MKPFQKIKKKNFKYKHKINKNKQKLLKQWLLKNSLKVSMCEKEFLHFGNMKPAKAVNGSEKQSQPSKSKRIAKFNSSTRTDHCTKHSINVKTVFCFVFV